MPTLAIRHPNGKETRHLLSGELIIGRQEDSDLMLAEGTVSRRHARIWVQGGQVLVEDLGSANGTFLDDVRISRTSVLRPESLLSLGGYEVRLLEEAEAPAPARSASGNRPAAASRSASGNRPAAARVPGARLLGLTEPCLNQSYSLQGLVRVGRKQPAEVLIDDESVSRQHAELEATARGVVLRDLGSANGTRLNGERVGQEEILLYPGDVLCFGVVEFAFESGEPGQVAARRVASGHSRASTSSSSRGWVLVGVGVAAALFWALAPEQVKELQEAVETWLEGSPDPEEPPAGVTVPPAPDPQVQIKEWVDQCRSHASSEGGTPDWDKALEACTRVLDLDPIHAEARELLRRSKQEKELLGLLSEGEVELATQHPEQALELFRKIPAGSTYHAKAQRRVREALAQVQHAAAKDCERLVGEEQWEAAVQRCERYMNLACQKMSHAALEPPKGHTLVLRPGKLRRNEWRPRDELYVSFLVARQKVDPEAPPWRCPPSEALGRP